MMTIPEPLGDVGPLRVSDFLRLDPTDGRIADINARVLHQLWSPTDGVFAERREVPFGQPVTAATIADLTIATDRL